MIGTRARWAPRRRATSKPSMSGSMTSRTIRSGLKAATERRASAPVPADSTAKPWNRRAIAMTSTMLGSSSTTRTRWAGGVVEFMALSIGAFAVSFLRRPAASALPVRAVSARGEPEDELGRLERHVELGAVADVVEHDPVGVGEPLGAVARGGGGPGEELVGGAPDDPYGAGHLLGVEVVALAERALHHR